ncbi:MAG: acyl-CoA dehydrogenase family protein [Chloroflexota bacterium]|nr:acyl-CoA/acyl-ACP dehydrogenase [Dehalococcoidia bacterium]MDW8254271.1 acyl-CoA dehydrogenase family protein [Chloroflexota bacterium]
MASAAAERAQYADVLRRTRLAAAVFAEQAAETDRAERVPRAHFELLRDHGLLGLVIPERYGGLGAGATVVRDFLEILAAACGTTAFTVMQHVLGVNQIVGGENEALREEWLPRYARGERFCGVAYSHVRRPGPPTLRVERQRDALVFRGEAPWFTGWGIMDDVVLAGTLPDGRYLFALVPLHAPGLSASAPLRLAAASASSTVFLFCDDLRVSLDRHVRTLTPAELAERDQRALLRYTALPLGVAAAASALLRQLNATRDDPAIAELANAIESECAAIREAADYWEPRFGEPAYLENAYRLRVWAIEAGMRAAHGAAMATGGTANLLTNPAQRLVREALLFSLNAQTADLRRAELRWYAAAARARTAEHGAAGGTAPSPPLGAASI